MSNFPAGIVACKRPFRISLRKEATVSGPLGKNFSAACFSVYTGSITQSDLLFSFNTHSSHDGLHSLYGGLSGDDSATDGAPHATSVGSAKSATSTCTDINRSRRALVP